MVKIRMLGRNKIKFIKDVKNTEAVCPICKFLARDIQDLESIQKEGACTECTLNFKYLDLEAWERGERPTTKQARAKMILIIGENK